MKYISLISLLFFLMLTAHASEDSRETHLGTFDVIRGGKAMLNGEKIPLQLRRNGTVPVVEELWLRLDEKYRRKYVLLDYGDGLPEAISWSTHLVVIDFSGNKVVVSPPVDTGLDLQWGDNNFALVKDDVLYFGIYAPKRMQFKYKDGKLEVNTGPWAGPAKPEHYIVPDKPGPCFNVANVPECIAEVERDEALRKKRLKKSKKPATPAPSGGLTVSH